jgi:hypothetical protein
MAALDAALTQAQRHADLGLPVAAPERFRLVKRVVTKLALPLFRRQIAFNHALVQSNRELAERVLRLQERIDRALRDDLLDFADRGVSQAHAELGDHVAEVRRVSAELILEIRSMEAELMTKIAAATRPLGPEQAPLSTEEQHDVELGRSTHERRR